MDLNFDCLDDKCHSLNGGDSDVTDECDIACTRDCCVKNKAFVSENVTGNDKVDGVASAEDNNSPLEFNGMIEQDNWDVAGMGNAAVCVTIDDDNEDDDENEDSGDKDSECKTNTDEDDINEEERMLIMV